jgi:hypothetical protein
MRILLGQVDLEVGPVDGERDRLGGRRSVDVIKPFDDRLRSHRSRTPIALKVLPDLHHGSH